ncbi:MAG: hypothetical protein QOD86_348 [Miltoncostaeaceae bacterium]|nr:hypothetical protein [Miltoncostaeaceae bacterium]
MADAAGQLERGRDLCARRAWVDAREALAAADRADPLGAEDLELLALASFMLGRDDDYVHALERAHRAHLDAGDPARAAGCAFWIGLNLFPRGEVGPATGWFGRGRRLVEEGGLDCVARGYLLIPELLGHVAAGDPEAAHAVATEAAEIAARFGDRDLFSLVVQEQGHALVRQGRTEEGLRLIDETMVAVTAGELSPVVTGLIYCNTISFCQRVYELRRACDWTAALSLWWASQPDMVSFTGRCLVHRAEVMQLRGAWADALEEARRAADRLAGSARAAGEAHYRQGELLRLRGETAAAEVAYRAAGLLGREPQPGLALLRLAQGDGAAAAAAIRRALVETGERLARAALLPACVEVMLAVGAREEAAAAGRELEAIAAAQGCDALEAMGAQARGAVALAEGDPARALPALRRAWRTWDDLEAPYESAQARVLVGLACRALGDAEAAGLELEAARAGFAALGATADAARAAALTEPAPPGHPGGLTARELQVLRLVATGASNRRIAEELVLSERTVDRHVSNILTKLRVPTRAAATAWAYERGLIGGEEAG